MTAQPLSLWARQAVQPERDVAISDIEVGERLRGIGEGAVADLMVSIEEVGLIQPIVLRPVEREGGEIGLLLVAGAHRLEAHRRLGRDVIRARIVHLSELDARQAEIDENLIRHDCAGWIRPKFIAHRGLIWAARHPEAVSDVGSTVSRGRGRPRKDQFIIPGTNSHIPVVMGFLAEVADETGLARNTLQQDAQMWAALHPFDEQISGSWLAHDTRALKQLAAQPPERRGAIVEAVVSGEAADVPAAIAIALGGSAPSKAAPTPVDETLKAFRKVWGSATPTARQAILQDLAGRALPKGWIVREGGDGE